jgi:hypothetical protein
VSPRLFLCIAMVGFGLSSGAARAADPGGPADLYPVGSAGMNAAVALAKAHWGTDPCGGLVRVRWVDDVHGINARSSWFNPVSSYDDPDLNANCVISLNANAFLPWPRFCTVVVHEYGHLSGHPHSPDPLDVMFQFLGAPVPECVGPPPDPPAEEPAR